MIKTLHVVLWSAYSTTSCLFIVTDCPLYCLKTLRTSIADSWALSAWADNAQESAILVRRVFEGFGRSKVTLKMSFWTR